MDKLRGTIISILSLFDRPLYRTEIVKLVYMIDEMYYKHFSKTITGVEYQWDNFGPNSIGDRIVNEAEALVNLGIVHMSSEPNQYGGTSYLYKLEKVEESFTGNLSHGERYVIKDVTCRCAKLSLQQLIDASKQTESFKDVKQFDPIKLKQSSKYQDIIKSLRADKEFSRSVRILAKELVK